MKGYIFDVRVHYTTDQIWANSEEEAREIANEELQYCGEECDTIMALIDETEDDEED